MGQTPPGSVPAGELWRDCPRMGTVPSNGYWDKPLRVNASALGAVRAAGVRLAAGRLFRLRPGRSSLRDLARYHRVGRDRDRLTPVRDLERVAPIEPVVGLALRRLDLQQPAAEEKAERELGNARRQAGGEAEVAVVVAHAAEAGDGREPGPCERRDVDAVARVVLDVVEVHQRRLAEVVIGQLE